MKTLCLRTALFTAFILPLQFAFAVTGGNIMGTVKDASTGQPVDGATVVLSCQGNQHVYVTDEKGMYDADNIPSGTYEIVVSYMKQQLKMEDVKLANDETRSIDLDLSGGEVHTLGEIPIVAAHSQAPLIDVYNPDVQTFTKLTLKDKPIQKITDVPQLMNVEQVGNNYYVRGARAGSLAYYIDGCKIMGDPNVPICGVELFRTYSGFIPAKYGDTTGGVIVIETTSNFDN